MIATGVGGNLVAVQASRISTSLHSSGSELGELPSGGEYQYRGLLQSFGASEDAKESAHVVLAVQ